MSRFYLGLCCIVALAHGATDDVTTNTYTVATTCTNFAGAGGTYTWNSQYNRYAMGNTGSFACKGNTDTNKCYWVLSNQQIFQASCGSEAGSTCGYNPPTTGWTPVHANCAAKTLSLTKKVAAPPPAPTTPFSTIKLEQFSDSKCKTATSEWTQPIGDFCTGTQKFSCFKTNDGKKDAKTVKRTDCTSKITQLETSGACFSAGGKSKKVTLGTSPTGPGAAYAIKITPSSGGSATYPVAGTCFRHSGGTSSVIYNTMDGTTLTLSQYTSLDCSGAKKQADLSITSGATVSGNKYEAIKPGTKAVCSGKVPATSGASRVDILWHTSIAAGLLSMMLAY